MPSVIFLLFVAFRFLLTLLASNRVNSTEEPRPPELMSTIMFCNCFRFPGNTFHTCVDFKGLGSTTSSKTHANNETGKKTIPNALSLCHIQKSIDLWIPWGVPIGQCCNSFSFLSFSQSLFRYMLLVSAASPGQAHLAWESARSGSGIVSRLTKPLRGAAHLEVPPRSRVPCLWLAVCGDLLFLFLC